MPQDPTVAALARETRNALTVVQGRLQLLRRRTGNGPFDAVRTARDLDTTLERLRRVTSLVEALELATPAADVADRQRDDSPAVPSS